MDICVLFDTIESPTGGGNQFLKALIAELARTGHRVSTRPTDDTEIVLLNGFNYASGRRLRVSQVAEIRQSGKMTSLGRVLPASYFNALSRRGPVLVHRVDGVPEIARGRRSAADVVQPAVNRLADHTIFQSEFCRSSFADHGSSLPDSSCVINNGVDPGIFFPAPDVPKMDGVFRLVATSWSPNHRKGFGSLAELSKLPGVQVVFAGNWCPDVAIANVELAGVLRSAGVADLLRTAHALVHASWNEACSNSIVEALACGLPVLYRDSGGNAELVHECGVRLTDNLEETVNSLIERYDKLRDLVCSRRHQFLVDVTARDYVAAFQYALGRRCHSG